MASLRDCTRRFLLLTEDTSCYVGSMSLADIPQIGQLTVEEKLQLVEDLWDSIQPLAEDLPPSDEEKALLNERFEAHQSAPESALTLEEFKRLLNKRL